jgi:outer membrane protein TolC
MNSRKFIFVSMLAAGLLMAGCVSAPTPENATAIWVPPAEAQGQDGVWKAVREQRIDLSKPQTLSELADISLRNNPASAKAWNDARVAAEKVIYALLHAGDQGRWIGQSHQHYGQAQRF